MARQTSDGEPSEFDAPPGWGPQRPWAPTPRPGGPRQWVLVALGLVVVLALMVGVILFFSRDSSHASESGSASQSAKPTLGTGAPTADAEFASARDLGPVGVLADDPTCTAWTGIDEALKAAEQTSWSGRDPSVPASGWTASRRDSYDSVATAMRAAADQTAPLAKQTPHRVMRELYEQTQAYLRAYADSIPNYTAVDDHLALTAGATSAALSAICEAISNGSATARGALIPPGNAPSAATPPTGSEAMFFVAPADPVCTKWHALVDKYTAAFAPWRAIDPGVPATQWDPAQRTVAAAAAQQMASFADEAEGLADGTTNGVFADFAMLAGEYRRAFGAALPSYVPADAALTRTASAATGAIDEGCSAVEG